MKFYVISSDGRKFGPADVQTLNQWVKENRLNRDTMLENADTGQQLHARDVPGLQFIAAAADLGGADSALKAGEKPLATTSFQTPGNPYVAGHPEQHSAPSQGQYASPPQPGSPYPRGGVYTPGGVPAELQGGFNVGAFFLTWIWGLNHRAYWTLWALLIGLIPCGGLIFAIYCGIKGNEAAWRSGRFSSAQECLACQRIWMWWGIGVVVFSIVGYIGLVILGVAFGGN